VYISSIFIYFSCDCHCNCFRTILAGAHLLLALAGLIDLVFVTRANAGWLPDWVLFLFGDAVFTGLVDRLGGIYIYMYMYAYLSIYLSI